MDSVIDPTVMFPFFLLVLRISAIIVMVPLFGDTGVSPIIKILLSLGLSAFFFKVYPITPIQIDSLSAAEVTLFLVKETTLGVIIGFVFRTAFFVVSTVGEAVSQASGFSAGRIFNPALEESSSVIGELFFLLVVFLFFAVKGEQLLLQVIGTLCAKVPLGHVNLSPKLFQGLIGCASGILQMAVRIAGPLILCVLVINIGMGIAGRFVPTLNVMALSFTVTLGASLWLIWIFLPQYVSAVDGIFASTEHTIFEMIGVMGG